PRPGEKPNAQLRRKAGARPPARPGARAIRERVMADATTGAAPGGSQQRSGNSGSNGGDAADRDLHDLAAERVVLECLHAGSAPAYVTVEHFAEPVHRAIFRAARDLPAAGTEVNVVTIRDLLRRVGSGVTLDFLTDLVESRFESTLRPALSI